MRHVLGVLGVLAAAVLLAVSAAMNWRFGYSLGKTELDGVIYGSASAAADCFKALVPFFFFAAIRNRMWSQAVASALVWVVVLAYSLTSALGHAALNRLDTAGQRAAHAQSYQDLRADLKRAEEQLGWIPQHRPAQTVQAEIESLKMQRAWKWSSECTDIKGAQTRGLCQKYQGLTSELASAEQADALGKRIDEVQAKLANTSGQGSGGNAVMSEADPQAAVLSKLVSFVGMGDVKVEDMQTALTIFVALLLEVGSGFGMYVAFSTWRLHEREALEAPRFEPALATAPPAPAPVVAQHVALAAPAAVAPAQAIAMEAEAIAAVEAPTTAAVDMPERLQPLIGPVSESIANDNKDEPMRKFGPPDSDVERFFKERMEQHPESSKKSVAANDIYTSFERWCEQLNKDNLSRRPFFREFDELGLKAGYVRGEKWYFEVAFKPEVVSEDEKRATVNEPVPAARAA